MSGEKGIVLFWGAGRRRGWREGRRGHDGVDVRLMDLVDDVILNHLLELRGRHLFASYDGLLSSNYVPMKNSGETSPCRFLDGKSQLGVRLCEPRRAFYTF